MVVNLGIEKINIVSSTSGWASDTYVRNSLGVFLVPNDVEPRIIQDYGASQLNAPSVYCANCQTLSQSP